MKEVGDLVFGRTRLIDDPSQRSFLLSQYTMSSRYQWINKSPHHFIIKSWPDMPGIKEEWHFVRDYDRYGDRLLHCTVSKSELIGMFELRGAPADDIVEQRGASERVFNGRDMSVPAILNERVLSRDEQMALDRVEDVHLDLSHTSSYGLERSLIFRVLCT